MSTLINKLAIKYKSLPLQVRATFWFLFCNAFQSGCRFLAMPFLVRLLNTEEYGIYSVFLSWGSIITIFATLNLHAGVYNNAMYKYPDRRDGYTSASQSLSVVLTAGCFAVYCLFRGFWDELFGLEPGLTVAIFIQLLFTESFLLWSSRQRYEYKYIALLVYTGLLSLLYLVVPVAGAALAPVEYRLDAVIFSGVLVQAGFGLAFMVRNYIKGKTFFHKDFWHFALAFNIPLIPHYLSGIILGQADRVMIKRFIGSAEAGIYSFTYNISLVINIITGAINNAIIPYTYDKLGGRDYGKLRTIANFLITAIGGLCLMFSAVAPEIIKLVATQEYYEAVYLVPVISLSSYFTFLYTLFANVEFFLEENRFITIASCVGAVANIVLNFLLLPVFGYYAAGYTTLFCYILFALSHYVFMHIVCKRHIGGDKVYDGKTIFVLSIVFVALAFEMMALYDYPIIRYTLVLAVVTACILKRKWIVEQIKEIRRENA